MLERGPEEEGERPFKQNGPKDKKKKVQHEADSNNTARNPIDRCRSVSSPKATVLVQSPFLDSSSLTTLPPSEGKVAKSLRPDLGEGNDIVTNQPDATLVETSITRYPPQPSTMSFLQGATGFEIKDSILSNVQGDVISFHIHSPMRGNYSGKRKQVFEYITSWMPEPRPWLEDVKCSKSKAVIDSGTYLDVSFTKEDDAEVFKAQWGLERPPELESQDSCSTVCSPSPREL